MISGSFLRLAKVDEQQSICATVDYFSQEPTEGQLIDTAHNLNLCGTIDVSFCLKIAPEFAPDYEPKQDDFIYVETPGFKLNLPCSNSAFDGISIDLLADETADSKPIESNIKIDAGPSVVEVYLTNTPNCSEGGIWQVIDSASNSWGLDWQNDETTVYAKFRDLFGEESGCVSDTINYLGGSGHDTTPPSSISISIDADASITASAAVTLTIGATDASEMYVTNTASCAADGTWEAYASTKAWTLGQSNSAASVYIKFRDQAGNESACISDSITHDDLAPSSPSVTVGSGIYTSANLNTLFLSATDASEMYITNSSACATGGVWETYATVKSNWSLAQSNSTATVYAKFRDAAGNESNCVNHSITHDNIAPSDPSNLDDGNTTHSASDSPTISWTAGSDGGSGLANYEVSIGTSVGATDIKDWTDVGNVTSTSFNDLTLTLGNNYFTNVRAVDNASNMGNSISSDSFLYGYLQQAYIKAVNGEANDGFGRLVAIDGDTIAVAVQLEDSNQTSITNGTTASNDNSNPSSGAVYVYKRTGTTWVQEAYI